MDRRVSSRMDPVEHDRVIGLASASESTRDSLSLAGNDAVRAQDDFPELFRYHHSSPSAAARSRLKRGLDLFLSLAMLIVSLPVALCIALAIKLDDGGPVFYRQSRWGLGGSPFRVFKFRTMISDSDSRYGILQASLKDGRITRVGRFLRQTGLDELPQLLNIFRGDMSFVGPRPLARGELIEGPNGQVAPYEEMPLFVSRLAVRPGLTGLATIYLPKDADPAIKLEYDQRYIKDWSFGQDLKLIAMSFLISFRGRWETRDPKLSSSSTSETARITEGD